MGHYDSCRDSTWELKKTLCDKSKDKKHNWHDVGYGIKQCRHCKKIIYYT